MRFIEGDSPISKVARAALVPIVALGMQGCGRPNDLDRFDYYTYSGTYDPTPKDHSSGDEFTVEVLLKLSKGSDPNSYTCPEDGSRRRLIMYIKTMPIYTTDTGKLIPETCTIRKDYE